MGCGLLVFIILAALVLVTVFGLVSEALGLLNLPGGALAWAVPLGIAFFILGMVALFLAGRALRRLSAPVGEVLEAAERLAGGDYSVRVAEQGPREIRSLAHAFNSMAVRLQSTDQERRNLLADVTHELRTPLTVIQGSLEGMLDGVYTADEAHLKSILEETQLLARLVGDLRTLALAESGALQLMKEPTDMAMLINDSVAAFRAQADEAGVALEVVAQADIPALVLDPERMREVLSNLIANALRYTPEGGSVRIIYSMTGKALEQQVEILVEDTGQGIPPQDLPHIFERFYKSRDSGGMGLGLAIARRLVEAHGGTVQAESLAGQGTRMRIILPSGAYTLN